MITMSSLSPVKKKAYTTTSEGVRGQGSEGDSSTRTPGFGFLVNLDTSLSSSTIVHGDEGGGLTRGLGESTSEGGGALHSDDLIVDST